MGHVVYHYHRSRLTGLPRGIALNGLCDLDPTLVTLSAFALVPVLPLHHLAWIPEDYYGGASLVCYLGTFAGLLRAADLACSVDRWHVADSLSSDRSHAASVQDQLAVS